MITKIARTYTSVENVINNNDNVNINYNDRVEKLTDVFWHADRR